MVLPIFTPGRRKQLVCVSVSSVSFHLCILKKIKNDFQTVLEPEFQYNVEFCYFIHQELGFSLFKNLNFWNSNVSYVSVTCAKDANFNLQGATIVYFKLIVPISLQHVIFVLKIRMYPFGMLHHLCQMYHFLASH